RDNVVSRGKARAPRRRVKKTEVFQMRVEVAQHLIHLDAPKQLEHILFAFLTPAEQDSANVRVGAFVLLACASTRRLGKVFHMEPAGRSWRIPVESVNEQEVLRPLAQCERHRVLEG